MLQVHVLKTEHNMKILSLYTQTVQKESAVNDYK